MIGSFATSRALSDGGYHGVYKPFYTKDQSFVLDQNGNKRVFRLDWEAEAIAWRECKKVERDHLNYLRLSPDQLKETPKFHEIRSRAGRFASVDRRLFKQKEAAE